jgi:hypothetical protein
MTSQFNIALDEGVSLPESIGPVLTRVANRFHLP